MRENKHSTLCLLLAVASLAAGCYGGGPKSGAENATAASSPSPESPPAAAEPDTYIATLVLRAEAADGERADLPELITEVARDGDARRVSVILPGSEQVVYLNRAGARYIILPARRQYAELPPGVRGLDLPRLLTPGEVIDYIGKSRGFVRAGEAAVGGRPAVKYLATGKTDADVRAGDLSAMTQVYVDKETGLPLRTELIAQPADDAPRGRVKAVTQMRDIRTQAERSLFEVPEGYRKVNFEQARQRMEEVTRAAKDIARSVLGQPDTKHGGG